MKREEKIARRQEERKTKRNNLSNLLANKIAPLFKSVHLRVSRAKSRGHANDPSSTPHYWPFPSRGREVSRTFKDVFSRHVRGRRLQDSLEKFLYLALFAFTRTVPRPAVASFVDAISAVKRNITGYHDGMVFRCYVDAAFGDNADPFGHLKRLRALEFWTSLGPACAWCATRGR